MGGREIIEGNLIPHIEMLHRCLNELDTFWPPNALENYTDDQIEEYVYHASQWVDDHTPGLYFESDRLIERLKLERDKRKKRNNNDSPNTSI